MSHILTRQELLAAETGTLRKSTPGLLKVALVYPNTYAVGMSNLGFHTIYRLLNACEGVVCERVFLPDDIDKTRDIRTLESNTLLADMDVIAFSVSFELDYPHIPLILRLGGIEPFAEKRVGPIVLAGGATISYNPEPIAPFIDVAVVGEAEEVIVPLIQAIIDAHGKRETMFSLLSEITGVYLPAGGPRPVARLVVRNLNAVPVATQVYTEHTEFGHMALVEVGRGCPYGCHFCVASHVYRPARWRTMDALLGPITEGLTHRQRVGLVGASVTDHPQIETICEEILRRGGSPSPASMRAEALSDALLSLLSQGGVRSITLAPEAGTESLRYRIGKRVSDAALISAALRARQAGIARLKLYFIIGLPGETPDDVMAIPALAQQIARETGIRVSLGCSAFVAKPGTPFARAAMAAERDIRQRFQRITRALQGKIQMTHESARWANWQGVLARGGREIAPALARIAESSRTAHDWSLAFKTFDLDPERYLHRVISPDEPMPWSHIGQCAVDTRTAPAQTS